MVSKKQYIIGLSRFLLFSYILLSSVCDLILAENYISLKLILAGDVHPHPGPVNKSLKFCHWNLNSILTRNKIKISLIEAYNSVFHYDLFAISESLLNDSIKDDEIHIEGFSKEIFRSDHPSGKKVGGVCLYFKENLPIKRRKDLEFLQETVISELSLGRKKIFFIVAYRSPNQTNDEFDIFHEKLQDILDSVKDEKPQCIILTGDLNCRSNQWWPGDTNTTEGIALDALLESNDLTQLIDQPTNIESRGVSCVDLIITDQPNLLVDYGIHSSLDNFCHHQIIYGKVNVSVPSPPPYKRQVWDYSEANKEEIRNTLLSTDWSFEFSDLSVDEMTSVFTKLVMDIMHRFIPNKTIKCNDKDPPWITPEIKTAIKRKHRVYNKYVRRGRKPDEWEYVRVTRNETSKIITGAKETYFASLGRKLSNPKIGLKVYWSTLNKIINKKKMTNIPPLLENGIFVANFQTKADIFNDLFVQQCSVHVNESVLPNFISRCNLSLANIDIDPDKVLEIIRSLDCNKAHGWDNLSVAMIKICDVGIVKPLCLIYNQCLVSGTFPEIWKKGNVIPVHKKESRQLKKNYRPISLLPI